MQECYDALVLPGGYPARLAGELAALGFEHCVRAPRAPDAPATLAQNSGLLIASRRAIVRSERITFGLSVESCNVNRGALHAELAGGLHVFTCHVTPGPGVASVADRGTLDAVAALRADSAPRQQCVGKRRRRTDVGDAGRTAQTYDVETKVGGGTAGRFGSAVELVGITVYGGREYLVRATASAAAWPAEKARLRRAVESFRILDAC